MPEPSLQPASCQSLIYILHSLSPSFLPSSCLSFSTYTFSNPLLLLRILSFERYSNTHIFQPFSDLAISALSYSLSVLLFFCFVETQAFWQASTTPFFSPSLLVSLACPASFHVPPFYRLPYLNQFTFNCFLFYILIFNIVNYNVLQFLKCFRIYIYVTLRVF